MPLTFDQDDTSTVSLAYGRGILTVPRYVGSDVVTPVDPAPLMDAASAMTSALREPIACAALRDQLAGVRTVVISVCDGTRPQPRRQMLNAVLGELEGAGVEVTVLVATGTHRGNTDAELLEMLGEDVLARCRVVNHDGRDKDSLVDFGVVGNGVPLSLNRLWVDADLRVTTGFVEPHFFAGFSGGPKMIAPGLAGLRTVLTLHDATRIGDTRATWGVVEDNPVHRDIRACAEAAPPHISMDVLLDQQKRITHVFAGELFTTHRVARTAAREVAMRGVDGLYDVVVTTNAGYPLDQNLYQAVKGMAAAERIVAPGGTIIMAAECADGLPDGSEFAQMLSGTSDPQDIAARLVTTGPATPDQWQAQIFARILRRARVGMFCRGLDAQQLKNAHLLPVADVGVAVAVAAELSGAGARVCYLPAGPQTIPYLEETPTPTAESSGR